MVGGQNNKQYVDVYPVYNQYIAYYYIILFTVHNQENRIELKVIYAVQSTTGLFSEDVLV